MASTKLRHRLATYAIGIALTIDLIAVAQQPGRQPTRRIEGQSPGAGQQQLQLDGNDARQPQRRVQPRNERGIQVDPNTGRIQIGREIFIQPPRMVPITRPRQWRLGIFVDNAPMGLRIRDVVPNGPAHRFGFEEGDYLLDVMGYPVGFHEGIYYPLASTLNQLTQRDGWVNLLVWNHRTGAAEAMWVQAEPRRGFGTPGRGFEARETDN